MNHAITVGGALAFVAMIVGIGAVALGLVAFFAGGMSDAPEAGEDASTWGCIVMIGGALLFALGLWGALA
jgi:hypothetical protein